MFCKYSNIFGKEKKGLHRYRVFNLAIVDVIGTFIIAFGLAYLFKWSLWITIICTFGMAIVLHRLFCVNTTINRIIFGSVA